MGYFPFFIDIKSKKCLIVGGGTVACRKVKKLIAYEPDITVIAPEICEEMQIIEYSQLTALKREFKDSDLDRYFFVIAASDNRELNSHISRLCKEKNILVNVADSMDECDFIFPSLYKRGSLSIGISTEGISPNLAVYYRNLLEKATPDGMEEILDFLESARNVAKEKIAPESRIDYLKECVSLCMSLGTAPDKKMCDELFNEYTGGDTKKGFVHIVGAGCSDMRLMTVQGLYLVQNADIIIYDDLIDVSVLDTAREECEKIYVGKRSGAKYMKQEDISALLVKKANEGKNVVRLKGGDPFVFGRGGEEIITLMENGIPFDEVSGITSAIAIPAEAGIPVTFREISRSLHIVTGHTKDGLPENIDLLAKLDGTLIFLMGVANMEKICSSLIENGKNEDTPAAVISGGNSKKQNDLAGTS